MEIKRFNKLNENENENMNDIFYIFIDRENYGEETYLFNNNTDLYNFFSNKIYNIFKDKFKDKEIDEDQLDDHLNGLDECKNADELISYLGDYNEYQPGFLYYETVRLDKDIKLEDWVRIRKDAKKYNL